jgi:O-6-methylguanine DNA methyltransferase
MNIEEQLANLRASAPTSVSAGTLLGTGLADGYAEFDSPVGTVVVTFNINGVSSVDLAEGDPIDRFEDHFGRRLFEAAPPKGWDRWIDLAIERGTPGKLPVDLRSRTSFQQEVLRITAAIPSGEVRPYSWLAKEVGNPGAVRAVGSTMARNPVPLIIPCHRVVRTDGHIGNYSLGGAHNKRVLLEVEGTHLDELERLASRRIRLWGSDSTKVYCNPTCRHARRITDTHLVEFHDRDEAEAAGYRACEVCRP